MKKLTISEMNRLDKNEYSRIAKIPVVVLLDNVRSLYNVGSVFRTADAFRIEEIILGGITATPENYLVEIHKTALGAEETVNWKYTADSYHTILEYKDKGYTIVSVEQVHDSIKLNDFVPDPTNKYVLVLGNEVSGVDQRIVDESQISLEIPQYGTKHSLNVSVTAGIVMWSFARFLLIDNA